MKFKDKRKCKRTIKATAKKFGVSSQSCRQEMQECIDEAWSTTDPVAKAKQLALFPKGKPTVEEFIATVAKQIK